MKRIVKNIKRSAIRLINNITWKRQYRDVVAGPRKTNFELYPRWYDGSKILMIVPHADDEIISSYSVLYNAESITLYYCGFTGSNNTEENKRNRQNEIFKLCSELNVQVIEGHGEFSKLEEILRKKEYDTILLPSIVDWHNEHREVSYMTKEVCSRLGITPKMICYSVTIPNESERAVLCVPLSKEQQIKKYDLFMKVYKTQRFMPVERLKLNERINGFHAECYAAEVFCKYEYKYWSKMVTKVKEMEMLDNSRFCGLVQCLKMNLNNIILIRHVSKEFYELVEE